MDADQHRLRPRHIALDQGDVLGRFHRVDVGDHPEPAAVGAVDFSLQHPLDDGVVAAAVGNKVGDGGDLEPVQLGKGDEIGGPRHRAVVLHDLAHHPCGVEPREACDVDGGLGVSGADQYAAVSRAHRKNVSRRRDVVPARGRIDGHHYGTGAVRRRDPGGDAFAGLDRFGERGVMARKIFAHHQRQPQLIRPPAGQRQADQPAPVHGHEVYGLGRRFFGRDDQVALVLTLLVVDEDDHLALAHVGHHLLDGRQLRIGVHGPGSSINRAR